jgi:hypothetical protein
MVAEGRQWRIFCGCFRPEAEFWFWKLLRVLGGEFVCRPMRNIQTSDNAKVLHLPCV